MKRLAFFALLVSLVPSLVAAQVTGQTSGSAQPLMVNLVQPGQPQSGQALPGATIAAVAIVVQSNSLAHISAIKVQKVGSANNAAIVGLQVNDSGSNIVGQSSGFDANNQATIPITETTDPNSSKTLLVSAIMAGSLTAYQGQSFELNITGVSSDAITTNGVLPVYGAQFTLSSGVPQPTCNISANTSSYTVGQTINVSWNSTNATGGTITGIGNVGPQGLQGILPGGTSQTLTGTFTGPGGTGTCSMTLTLTSSSGGVVSSNGGVSTTGGVNASSGPFGSTIGGTVTPGVGPGTPGGAVAPGGGATPASSIIPCSGLDCRPCDVAPLIQNFINLVIGLSIPAAAVLFAMAGILYFTSAANPSNIARAKAIFKVVFWGFLLAVSAWIIVQLLLRVVLSPDYYNSWNSITCVAETSRPGIILPNGVNTTTNVGSFFNAIGSINTNAPVPVVVTSGSAGSPATSMCPNGSSFSSAVNGCVDTTTGECTYSGCGINPSFSANSYVNQNFSGGACGGLSAQAACVAKYESSCNSVIGSGVDIGSDGNSVSWGLFQVNLSANSLQCNGQTLNCPAAFGGGSYTAKNHNTYVTDQTLYNQCVNLAQDPQCSQQMYSSLLSKSGGSLKPWGTAAQANCSGL